MIDFSLRFGSLPFKLVSFASPDAIVENPNIHVHISPKFYDRVQLTWEVPLSWGSCKYNIYKSESEAGPWRLATSAPLTTTLFTDLNTKEHSKFRSMFYIVEVILPNGSLVKSKPTTWDNVRNSYPEILAREISRREWLLLRKFVGVSTIVFKRVWSGPRCPNCWEHKSEKVITERCHVCYGTSFDGGYYAPFETLLQYDVTPNSLVIGEQGKTEPNTITAWTISFPQITPFDIIYRVPDHRMYRVDAVQTTELQAVPVRQILQITDLSKDAVEFNLVDS